MEKDAHYFRVGVYLIGLTLLAAAFAIWVAKSGSSDDMKYRIFFRESVSGLPEGGAVKYRGVEVGKVDGISINERDPRMIQVDVKVGKHVPVKVDTKAHLKMQGVTGVIYVELSGGAPEAKKLVDVTPEDQVPVIPSEESGISLLVNQMPIIMEKLSHFADQMNKLVSDENLANFGLLLNNTTTLTSDVGEVVRSTKQDTKQMMMHLRKASRDINDVTETVKEDPSSLIFPPEEEGISPP